MLRPVWLALAAMLLLPPVLAQGDGIHARVASFAGPLPFDGEGAEARVTVEASCELAAAHPQASIVVERVPDWASATVEHATLPLTCGAGDSVASAVTTLRARADLDAPGLAPEPIVLRVQVGPESRAVEVVAQAAFRSQIEVTADATEKVGKPQEAIVFTVTVTNGGNAATKIFVNTTATGGFLAIQPVSITLPSALDEGGAKPVSLPISVQTPYRNGRVDETGIVHVAFLAVHALQPNVEGDRASLSFVVHAVGTYVPAPAVFGPLALAALLLRRW